MRRSLRLSATPAEVDAQRTYDRLLAELETRMEEHDAIWLAGAAGLLDRTRNRSG